MAKKFIITASLVFLAVIAVFLIYFFKKDGSSRKYEEKSNVDKQQARQAVTEEPLGEKIDKDGTFLSGAIESFSGNEIAVTPFLYGKPREDIKEPIKLNLGDGVEVYQVTGNLNQETEESKNETKTSKDSLKTGAFVKITGTNLYGKNDGASTIEKILIYPEANDRADVSPFPLSTASE